MSSPHCIFSCPSRIGTTRSTLPLFRATSWICWSCCWSQSSSQPLPIPAAAAWCPLKPCVLSASCSRALSAILAPCGPSTSWPSGSPAMATMDIPRWPELSPCPNWRAGCVPASPLTPWEWLSASKLGRSWRGHSKVGKTAGKLFLGR